LVPQAFTSQALQFLSRANKSMTSKEGKAVFQEPGC